MYHGVGDQYFLIPFYPSAIYELMGTSAIKTQIEKLEFGKGL